MPNSRLQLFRNFLTERFTAAAVEILEEVENVVEGYYEENKRLKKMLNTVLNPEIKRRGTDQTCAPSITTVLEHPSEHSVSLQPKKTEPCHPKIKEEQEECLTSQEGEHHQAFDIAGTMNSMVTPICVKSDIEQDLCLPRISESYSIPMVEWKEESSSTITADDMEYDNEEETNRGLEAITDSLKLSTARKTQGQKCSQCEGCGKSLKKKRKARKPLQKTVLETPRRTQYKAYAGDLPDCESFLLRLTEAFKDIPDDKKPLIAKMGHSNVELVDCTFGRVPKDCPLSYQCPIRSSYDYRPQDDAPPPPCLPLASYKLEPVLSTHNLSDKEQERMEALEITWAAAHNLECATRGLDESVEGLRQSRLTSRFREICHLRGKSRAQHLAFKMRRGMPESKALKMNKEQRPEALREYCKYAFVNWSPCGLVVHPDAPWLGAIPDGLIYDPTENPKYGLVHVKYCKIRNFVDYRFLHYQYGVLELKKTHSYYWQMQGEMMVTGTDWCDLVVFTDDDILVQRVYRNKAITKVMKEKLDNFFFSYHLPGLLSES
ncbi:uncharacterized protein ACJ7VT_011392 [Polymixia lowei]